MADHPAYIELKGICKSFGPVVANHNINLSVEKGEIHALLGENGSGKSTLMNMLSGIYSPDAGEIYLDGKAVSFSEPAEAIRAGIGMVHQHFKLVDVLTAKENIVAGKEKAGFFIKQKELTKEIQQIEEKYGLIVDPDKKIYNMSVSEKQTVEILKVLYRGANILILDEPTAVLTPQEIDELMKIMKELVSEGKSILFITHKLNEIKAVADRCTVLRKGRYIGTVDVASTTKEEMSEMMVGRKVNLNVEKTPAQPGEVVLSARGVCVKGHGGSKNVVDHVDFDVRRGEIVCIAGIDGNGQTELVYALTGLVEPEEGTVTLNGQDITHAPIRRRNAGGLGHIPEDRHRHGLVLDYNLAYNLVLQSYFEPEFCSRGFLKYDAIYEYADKLIGKFDIRSGQGARTITRSMSGGNQQKAIVAREIDRDPDVLIAVQPTRGLDVGAIEYIHGKLVEERDAGKAILLVSLELDEVMQLSDRILVIYEGRIVADLDPKTVTVQELGLYMAGSGRRAVQ